MYCTLVNLFRRLRRSRRTHVVGIVILFPEPFGNGTQFAVLEVRRAFRKYAFRCTLDVGCQHAIDVRFVKLDTFSPQGSSCTNADDLR